MKKILFILILVLLVFQGISQQKFRLHVQPGKPQLAGDGEDYTTLIITARDPEGEVITSMNGKVAVRVSAGFCEAIEVEMQDGIALVKYTSPMFGTPIKASQRMVYFMVRFMQKFVARSGGSTDSKANEKLATDITIETFKEGLIPTTLIPQKAGDNFAYIVCEMNGVKGKAKIEILKASEGRNGSIVPGVYYGRDITGQSDWKLNIFSSGKGTFGEANSSEDDYNTIMFSNEEFKELNDMLSKTSGMTGFLKAYLGPSWKESQYIKDYDIEKMGMGSAYMPMPNNSVFLYTPPILFEYKGRPVTTTSSASASGNPEELVKTDKSGIILSQNEIIGDGKCRTKAVFHYQDENGVPVSGKNISWAIPKGLKQISVQTVTDANGNAETILEAPILKATGETRGENTGQIIDNYDLYKITVNYASPKRASDYTEAYLSVYKTIERNVRILKPGFEAKSFKLLLPQLEHFKLESSVYALIEMMYSPSVAEKTSVNDAVVFIERKKFDEEKFNRYYETYFKKDRKLFLNMLDDEKGGFCAISNSEGKFTLNVGVNPDKKLAMEPLQAKLSDLTGRRKGSLGSVLSMFEDNDFQNVVIDKLYAIDKSLCTSDHLTSVYTEEKLHVLGTLMTNTNGASKYMRDCAKNFSEQSWEALKFLSNLANEQFKFTENLGKWAGNTEIAKKLAENGIKADKYIWNTIGGQNTQNGTYSMVYRFLFNNCANEKVAATQEYCRLMGEAANYVIGEKQKLMIDATADAIVNYLPFPEKLTDKFIKMYYAGQKQEILKLLNQDLLKVHGVYEKLQPALVDRSATLRQHYLDIASWRLNSEEFKAYKDLFNDLVVKGAIIIGDVATQNYASIKGHLETLEKANKMLDASYITVRLYTEFQNYRNLWAESDAAFIYTNMCITQGSMAPVAQNKLISFSIFPEAIAAGLPDVGSLNGVPPISESSLNMVGGNLPVNELNKMFDGYPAFDGWFNQNADKLAWLSVAFPNEFKNVVKARENYNSNLLSLTVLVLGITQNPSDDQLKLEWNKVSTQLAKSSSDLIKGASDASQKMKTMQAQPSVGDLSEKQVAGFFKNKMLIYIGAGSVVLIIVILVLIVIRRRRKKSHKSPTQEATSDPLPYFPAPPVAPRPSPLSRVAQSLDPQVRSQPTQQSPKFCPHCGSEFKPGARFCGKCGFKAK